jgi:iron complex outermembrane recepter protein
MKSSRLTFSVKQTLRAGAAACVAAAGLAVLLAPVEAAYAEDQVEGKAPAGLEEVVVTARRKEERLQDVPVAATAITAAEIQQYNITNIANVKVVAPQVSFDRAFTGSGTSIAMRGISSSSLDAGLEQSVLLDFDGMPISRGRILSDAIFDVQAIDVLKGPQSLFFGKNTPGGVVSVRSANPTDEFEAYARMGYEFTSRAPSLEAAISGPINETLGFRLAVYGSQSDGYILNQSAGIADPYRTARLPTYTGGTFVPAAPQRLGAEEKYGVRGTLTFDNGEGLDATFKMLATYTTNQGLQSFTENMSCAPGQTRPRTNGIVDPNGDCKLNNRAAAGFMSPDIVAAWPEIRSWNTGEPGGSNDSYLPTLTVNYAMDALTLTSTTGFYKYHYKSAGSADATSYAFFWSYQNETFEALTEEVRLFSTLDGPLNFALGGYYESSERTLKAGALNGPNSADPFTGKLNTHDNRWDNETDAYSFFGQLIFTPIEQLEIAGGARYTKQDRSVAAVNTFVNNNNAAFRTAGSVLKGDYSEDNTSPEATVTWKFSPDLMVYGAYKTGYLSGGFSNLGTLTASITLPALTYKPEEVDGYEIGTKFSLLDRTLTGSLVAYTYDYDGLQLTTFNATLAQPSFTTTNAASTKSEGIELDLNYRPVQGLSLRGSVNYNDAKFEKFENAQCYAGQTAAQGCVTLPGRTTRAQDLSGAPLWRAPEWIYTAGFLYEFGVGESLKMTVNADLRNTSGYFVSTTENPGSYQDGFTALNAGVRLGASDDAWSVALIGRNITDEIYATLGTDKPGGSGEVMAVAGEPRAVVLQLETRF